MKSVLHQEADATYRPHLHKTNEPALSQKASNRIGLILILWGILLLMLGSGLPAVIIVISGGIIILDGYLMTRLKANRKGKAKSPEERVSSGDLAI